MLIALLATAAAQDTRIEVSLDAGGVGGPVTFPADAFRISESKPVNVAGIGGGGAGAGRRNLDALEIRAPLFDRFDTPLLTHGGGFPLAEMVVRVFATGPGGTDLLVHEYEADNVVLASFEVSATEAGAWVDMTFAVGCLVVTETAYDDLGMQAQSTTNGWSQLSNSSCTLP